MFKPQNTVKVAGVILESVSVENASDIPDSAPAWVDAEKKNDVWVLKAGGDRTSFELWREGWAQVTFLGEEAYVTNVLGLGENEFILRTLLGVGKEGPHVFKGEGVITLASQLMVLEDEIEDKGAWVDGPLFPALRKALSNAAGRGCLWVQGVSTSQG